MYPLKIFLQHEETGGNDRPNFTARKADTRGTRRIVFPLEKGGFTLRTLKQPVVFLRKTKLTNMPLRSIRKLYFYFYEVKIAVRRFTGLQASGAHTKCETLAKNGLTAVFRGVTAYMRHAD
ncbi:hypothetical protein [Mucilaginibacter antarcticus]|uniref:hypothetical protein n=1 Tax=Mucilaginibacter antarcticus TaxID=1855725 RepID=UPI00362C4055